jgi:hypothetical protein
MSQEVPHFGKEEAEEAKTEKELEGGTEDVLDKGNGDEYNIRFCGSR